MGLSGVWVGYGVRQEGMERALLDPRGRLVGAQILLMRAVWPRVVYRNVMTAS